MVFWAQGKRQACHDRHEQGRASTVSNIVPTGNLRGSQTGESDWLDQWYPIETTVTTKTLKSKGDHVAVKSRWGWEKRPEQAERCQTRLHQPLSVISTSSREVIGDQRVYSITSDQHFNSDTYLHARSKGEEYKDLSILNTIAKHILKLDNKRDDTVRPLKSSGFESIQHKPKEIRDPTFPSPRNVEGALASPFYDPDFWVPRRPLAPNRVYHFHVIYNHAQSSFGRSSDTDLALRVTASLVEKLELRGYVNGYYHDRDKRSDHTLAAEMERVISGSSLTILLLTPGFVRDCMDRYLQIEAFRKLLTEPSSPRNQLVIMGVGVTEASLPLVLGRHEVLFFKENDWETDHPAWARLDSVLLGNLRKKRNTVTSELPTSNIGTQQSMKELHTTDFHNTCHQVSGLNNGTPDYQNPKTFTSVLEHRHAYIQEGIGESTQTFSCLDDRENRGRTDHTDPRKAVKENLTEHWVHYSFQTTKPAVLTSEKIERRSIGRDTERVDHNGPEVLGSNSPSGKYFRLTEHLLYADDLHNLGHDHVAWDPGGQQSYSPRSPLCHKSYQFGDNQRFGSENGDEYKDSSDDGSDLTVLDNTFDSIEFGSNTRDNHFYRSNAFGGDSLYRLTLDDNLDNIYHQRQQEQKDAMEEFEFENIEDVMLEDSTTESVHTLDSLELEDMQRRYGFEMFRDAQFRDGPLSCKFDSAYMLDSEELQEMRRQYGFEELEMDTSRTESSVCTLDTTGLEELRERYGFEHYDLSDAHNVFDDHDLLDGINQKLFRHVNTSFEDVSGDNCCNDELRPPLNIDKETDNLHTGMTILSLKMSEANSTAPQDTRYDSSNQRQFEAFKSKRQLHDLSYLAGDTLRHYDSGETNPFVSETPTIEELWAKWVDCPSMQTHTSEACEGAQQTDFNLPDIAGSKYHEQEIILVTETNNETKQDSQDLASICGSANPPCAPTSEHIISLGNLQKLSRHFESSKINDSLIVTNETTASKRSTGFSEASEASEVDITDCPAIDSPLKNLPSFPDHNTPQGMKHLVLQAPNIDIVSCGDEIPLDQEDSVHSDQHSISYDLATDSLDFQLNDIEKENKDISERSELKNTQNEGKYPETAPSHDPEDNIPNRDKKCSASFGQNKTEILDKVDGALRKDLAVSSIKEVQAIDYVSETLTPHDKEKLPLQGCEIILEDQERLQLNSFSREAPTKEQNNSLCYLEQQSDFKTNYSERKESVIEANPIKSTLKVKEKNFHVESRCPDLESFDGVEKKKTTSVMEEMTSTKTTEHEQSLIYEKGNHIEKVNEKSNESTGDDTISPGDSITNPMMDICEEENTVRDIENNTVNNFDSVDSPVIKTETNNIPIAKEVYAENWKDNVENSTKELPLTQKEDSRAQRHKEACPEELHSDESKITRQGVNTYNQEAPTQESKSQYKHPRTAPDPWYKKEDVETAQLNIVALNVAHEILTHMLMAKTVKTSTQAKNEEAIHPQLQKHSMANKESTCSAECDKESEKTTLENQTQMDHTETPTTSISTGHSFVEEHHNQLLANSDISYEKESASKSEFVDIELPVSAALSFDEPNKETSSLKDEENSVQGTSETKCGENVLEHGSTIEDFESAPHSLQSVSVIQPGVSHLSKRPVLETPPNEEHIHENSGIFEMNNEPNDTGSDDKQQEIDDIALKYKHDTETSISKEASLRDLSQDEAFEPIDNPGVCEPMALNLNDGFASLESNIKRENLYSDESTRCPVIYNMSNVEQISAVSRDIVKDVLISSLNRLRTTISEISHDDRNQPKTELNVSKETTSSIEQSVFQNHETGATNCISDDDDGNKPFRVEIDAENSFSEMQFRQASSPRTRNDDYTCQESLPSAISSLDDVLISFQTEENDSGPLLLADLQHGGTKINEESSKSSGYSEVTVGENLTVCEPNLVIEERANVNVDLNAELEEASNGASLSPRYHHYHEGDSGFFDPCDSTASRDETEINLEHRATAPQMKDNREDPNRSHSRPENHVAISNSIIQKDGEIQRSDADIVEDINLKTNQIDINSEVNFVSSTLPVNARPNDTTDDHLLDTDGIVNASVEKGTEEKDISSTTVESFYFREKAIYTKEDLYLSENQAEFRNTSVAFSQNADISIQPAGSNQYLKTNRLVVDSQRNAPNNTQESDLTSDTENNTFLCDTNETTDTDVRVSISNQATNIITDQTELNQDTSTNIFEVISASDSGRCDVHSNKALATNERQPEITQNVIGDAQEASSSHQSNLDFESSTLGQYFYRYAPHVQCDQNTSMNEQFVDPREEPFRDIHVVGVSQEGIHRTLEQPCYRTDAITPLQLAGLNLSPRLASQAAFGLNPEIGDSDETSESTFNINDRLAVDHLGASFLSPRLSSPRAISRMTPRSRSNFERLRAMHRQMHGISSAGLQLTDPSVSKPSEEASSNNPDGETSTTDTNSEKRVDQTKGEGGHDGNQASSSSWLLGIYKGVCHTLAKPDMPYLG